MIHLAVFVLVSSVAIPCVISIVPYVLITAQVSIVTCSLHHTIHPVAFVLVSIGKQVKAFSILFPFQPKALIAAPIFPNVNPIAVAILALELPLILPVFVHLFPNGILLKSTEELLSLARPEAVP